MEKPTTSEKWTRPRQRQSQKKSVENTVFVRFVPSCAEIRRHHLEDLFSQVGPIKKSAVIHPKSGDAGEYGGSGGGGSSSSDKRNNGSSSSSSYAFVKYTTSSDAKEAVKTCHGQSIRISASESVQVRVCLASSNNGNNNSSSTTQTAEETDERVLKKTSTGGSSSSTVAVAADDPPSNQNKSNNNKKKNRVIVRNLSFYATANHVRKALEGLFGPVDDVHIPTVGTGGSSSTDQKNKNRTTTKATATTHRGFCFVTFDKFADAQKAVLASAAAAAAASASRNETNNNEDDDDKNAAATPITIYHRPVQISFCQNKASYEKSQQQQQQRGNGSSSSMRSTREEIGLKQQDNDEQATSSEKQEGDDDDGDSSSSSSSSDDDSTSDDDDDDDEEEEQEKDSDGESDTGGSDSFENDDGDAMNDIEDDENEDDNEDGAKEEEEGGDGEEDEAPSYNDGAAVAEKRSIFCSNLPFDCTRHDLFALFKSFGRITGIYLVYTNKQKEQSSTMTTTTTTRVPKGTAFVSFATTGAAQRALDASGSSEHQVLSPMMLKGRSVHVQIAVDKQTARTLSAVDDEKKHGKVSGRDLRFLYLKGEGRVDRNDNDDDENATNGVSNNPWDDLPEKDQRKRQNAWSEKIAKLKSPLFAMNPARLVVRNLAKHVTEQDLKRLCVAAAVRGLGQPEEEKQQLQDQDQEADDDDDGKRITKKKGSTRALVSVADVARFWRAAGELTPRQILERIQQYQNDDTEEEKKSSNNGKKDEDDSLGIVIPRLDTKNVKRYVPSVFIQRDFDRKGGSSGGAAPPPSRGYGFVEFAHHVHALACLRELNNNARYSAEYAAGGKQALMQRQQQQRRRRNTKKKKKKDVTDAAEVVRIPRCIVEFAVENKAKAKLQVEHRAQQAANQRKQKLLHLQQQKQQEDDQEHAKDNKRKKKKSRGARQRERKRKLQQQQQEQEGHDEEEEEVGRDREMHQQQRQEQEREVERRRRGDHQRSSDHRDQLQRPRPIAVKPPKKKKQKKKADDLQEEAFLSMVESYKARLLGTTTTTTTTKTTFASTGTKNNDGRNDDGDPRGEEKQPTTTKKKKTMNKRWFD